MDLEFDKEIDALLRKARDDRGVLVGDSPRQHLDADELAAFAENVLPERTRMFFTTHLADCNRCRKILSSLILINAEAEPETAFVSAPVTVGTSVPWYRKLFLFPNIAYVMGSLVLLFSGFFAFSVFQELTNSLSSDVSLINDSETPASGPSLGDEPFYSDSSANSAMNATNGMNSAANRMANASNSTANTAVGNSNSLPFVVGRALDAPSDEILADRDKGITLDGVDAGAGSRHATAAAPPPAPAPAPTVRANEETDARSLGTTTKDQSAEKKESRELAKRKVIGEDMLRTDPRGPAKSSGPSRDMQSQFPNRAENSIEIAATRAVGGKKFQRKDSVWYDTAYRGQATTNVRRGTVEYRKLDNGLRVIAESLDGVIVTVWKDKAYRIQ